MFLIGYTLCQPRKNTETVSCFYASLEAVAIHFKAKTTTSIYIFTHSLDATGSLKGCTDTGVKTKQAKKKKAKESTELYTGRI